MLPRTVLGVLIGAALLMSAAVWNGYPLTFWDTRAYVEHAGSLLPRPDRLIGYSLWIRALSWRLSLWPVVTAQCVLMAALTSRVCRVVTPGASMALTAPLFACLTVATALPWIAGQLMADIFTPALVLALFLLLEQAHLARWERAALLMLVAVCVCMHLTHFPLGMAVLVLAWIVLKRRGEPRAFQRAALPAVALMVGLVSIGGFNFARTGKLTYAAGGDAFVLAHLVESGIASRVLDERCHERDYWLCRHRDRLPMGPDELLWVDKLGLDPWMRTEEVKRETRRLLLDSLRDVPWLHVRVAVTYTLRTLARFGTGEGLDSDAAPLVEAQIARFAPGDLPAFRAAKQQANAVPVASLRVLHTPTGWLLMAIACVLIARGSFQDRSVRFLCFVFAALLINAALSGNLAGIYDRYQSRLVWMLAIGVWGHLTAHLSRALP